MPKKYFAALLAAILTVPVISAFGAGLEVYLVEGSLPNDRIFQLTDLRNLSLVEPPLIAVTDIESYDWSTHTINLKPECGERLFARFAQRTRIPMISRLFVVTIDAERVYLGALIGFLSSWAATEVPVIGIPFDDAPATTLRISKAAAAPDQRSDARIRTALEQAGVLVEE